MSKIQWKNLSNYSSNISFFGFMKKCCWSMRGVHLSTCFWPERRLQRLDLPLDDWSPECPFSVHLWCPARNRLEPCCIYGAGVWGQCVVARWYWAAVCSKRKSEAVGMMLSQFSIAVGEHLLNLLNSCESQSDEKSWEAGGRFFIN